MAYRIQGTTEDDTELLDALRQLARKERISVSEMIRQAFMRQLDGKWGRK